MRISKGNRSTWRNANLYTRNHACTDFDWTAVNTVNWNFNIILHPHFYSKILYRKYISMPVNIFPSITLHFLDTSCIVITNSWTDQYNLRTYICDVVTLCGECGETQDLLHITNILLVRINAHTLSLHRKTHSARSSLYFRHCYVPGFHLRLMWAHSSLYRLSTGGDTNKIIEIFRG
jgi:hypothetical protein